MRRASDVPRDFASRVVPFRFEPTTPVGRCAVDAATDVMRLTSRGVRVSPELRKRWYDAARRAAYAGRRHARPYSWGSFDEGEAWRFEAVVAGCMRLAAARLASENSSP